MDVEDDETSTLFVDAILAFEILAGDLKAAVADRKALFVQPLRSDTRQIDMSGQHQRQEILRPIVLAHPTTAQPLLFVNEQHVERIEGLHLADSRVLLGALFDHLYDEAHTFEHRWRNGDLIFWDNIALQHGRREIIGVRRRKLQRASVAERSLLEQIPDFFDQPPDVGAVARY